MTMVSSWFLHGLHNNVSALASDLFVVAFVKTTYTVDENVGSVSVCVNLTQPAIDILDETVNVSVIGNFNSMYIPAGSPQASKVFKHTTNKYTI